MAPLIHFYYAGLNVTPCLQGVPDARPAALVENEVSSSATGAAGSP